MNKCKHEGCENTPRYINGLGEVRCGIHDIEDPWSSIRISDIPTLLVTIDGFLRMCDSYKSGQVILTDPNWSISRYVDKIKETICLKVKSRE